MTTSPNALALTRPLLLGLTVLNALYALAIGALLVATLIHPPLLSAALGMTDGQGPWEVRAALRAVVVLGLIAAYVVHRVLRELLAIVDTVRSGDPFVADNARRLQAIAWWVLVGEALRLLIGTTAWSVSGALSSMGIDLDLDIGFSFAPWLAVLLLFVLARVFEQGARMRADLEGTV